jgi:hypothetical protein
MGWIAYLWGVVPVRDAPQYAAGMGATDGRTAAGGDGAIDLPGVPAL